MKRFLFAIIILFFVAPANAQSGVLIPLPKDAPDEKMLSIAAMNVNLCVDNQTAKVQVTQIYENHTAQTLEGKFVFALPESAAVSDFAVWDGATRIPGVMMEKRRANAIYSAITAQKQIDPGILQTDETTAGKSVFSARVFPIPPFGTKRVEMEYRQNLPLENFSSHLAFPLKNSIGAPQTAAQFSLSVCAYNEFPFTALSYSSEKFPLQISNQTAHEFAAGFKAENFVLDTDFALDYAVSAGRSLLSFIAYRAPESISAFELRNPALAQKNADGYFEMRAVFNENQPAQRAPRRIVLTIDTSLSMYGEKLARAVEAADLMLHDLTESDEFNLILFGNEPLVFSPNPLKATPDAIENALGFVKNSNLGGGTNLKKALEKSLESASNLANGEKSLILISDAAPTRETINKNEISSLAGKTDENLKIYGLAIGSDAETTIFNELAKRTNGFYSQMRETEEVTPFVQLLLSKLGGQTIEDFNFTSDTAENFYEVYATGEHSFSGSSFSFVGRYRQPQTANVNLRAHYGENEINLLQTVELPALADFHDHLPSLWARARIDWLVREMDLSGEREDYITEIIALSQKHKILSPYTAFIAAPRALLRPRLIQPGDPVIRVKTDESITQIFAVLPFGETLPLEFLADEGVWETRFLAPSWMKDGAYNCRLILTDKNGNGFEETKTFIVDSSAPVLKINLLKTAFQSGEEIEIRVAADKDTAKLHARLYGAKPVQLYWSDAEKANIGKLVVPRGIASGKYLLTVSAEDFAHNQSSEEIPVEILAN